MRSKERERWMALVEHEREAHRQEVAALVTRIQHPEVIQPAVQPIALEPHDPVKEAAYSWVGEMVPEFVDVGAPHTNEKESQ